MVKKVVAVVVDLTYSVLKLYTTESSNKVRCQDRVDSHAAAFVY